MARPEVTGLGSWPGPSPQEATGVIRDLLAEDGLPYLPELPARGPGADLIGRTAALLVDLPVDLQPSGWRLTDAPGRDLIRATSFWSRDLDALAEAYDGYTGRLKVQVCGPWTAAASIALPRGEKVLSDAGAIRDLSQSLAAGIAAHLVHLRQLVPGASWVLQVDEPALPAVLAGSLRSVSGFSRLPSIEPGPAQVALSRVLAAAGDIPTVVHCCASQPPISLVADSGGTAVAVDVRLLDQDGWEQVAEALEGGLRLWAGCVPTDGSVLDPRECAEPLVRAWSRLGLSASALGQVTLTPACGLAGSSQEQARSLQRVALQVAEVIEQQAG